MVTHILIYMLIYSTHFSDFYSGQNSKLLNGKHSYDHRNYSLTNNNLPFSCKLFILFPHMNLPWTKIYNFQVRLKTLTLTFFSSCIQLVLYYLHLILCFLKILYSCSLIFLRPRIMLSFYCLPQT